MELLAPAGNIENFHAAIDAGADAVYVGAPGINARNLSRDLRFEEIAAIIDHAHRLHKKVYLAANSLILERDLQRLIRDLAIYEELAPDALIVQDLSLVTIITEYFPSLTLHASTLMGAHNSAGVKVLSDMGCSRVVVARELTLKEIAHLQKKSPVELEVFIHGAMCYSFSGLCMFSSYLGGKSGLRGRCVQPCRRNYNTVSQRKQRGQGKGGTGNYLFSMNDLSGLEAVAQLKQIGISSLKIEGRLRTANYVGKVVEAYRLVIDADKPLGEEIHGKAQSLVIASMARKTASGYLFTPQPGDAISAKHSGNLGLHVGVFTRFTCKGESRYGEIRLKHSLSIGDRLRIHCNTSGERKAFSLKVLQSGEEAAQRVESERVAVLGLPDHWVFNEKGKVDLYKVDGAGTTLPRELESLIVSKKNLLEQITGSVGNKTGEVESALLKGEYVRNKPVQKKFKDTGRKRKNGRFEIWLKVDSEKLLFSRLSFQVDAFVLEMENRMLQLSGKIKKHFGKNIRQIIWALPSIILESDLKKYQKQVKILIRSGFRNFQIGHISQIELFGKERVNVFGGSTLNASNSQVILSLASLGLKGCQASMELDKNGFASLAHGVKTSMGRLFNKQNGVSCKIGLTMFGAPSLFISRIAPPQFQIKKDIISPKGEMFYLKRSGGLTHTLPKKPFSLFPFKEEIMDMGYVYGVVDLCKMNISDRYMNDLKLRIEGKKGVGRLPSFNYLGRLE